MLDISDLKSLVAAIRPHVSSRGTLIGVEGHSTSGKTTLSKTLADQLGGTVVSTDDYVDSGSNHDSYPRRIRLGELRKDLAHVRSLQPVVFFEGICLRRTLELISLVPKIFVYCKRISRAGLWADDPQNHTENGRPLPGLSWVDLQSVVYHLRAKPLENADLVYAWQEE